MTEAIIAGIIGLLVPIVSFFFEWVLKNWSEKAIAKKREEAAQVEDEEKTVERREDLVERNESIQKQKEAASDWNPE